MNHILELLLDGISWLIEVFWIQSSDSKLMMFIKSSIIFIIVCALAYALGLF